MEITRSYPKFRKRLVEWGFLTPEEIKELEEKIMLEVEEAEIFANSSPYPPIESLYDDLYTDMYADSESSIKDLATAED